MRLTDKFVISVNRELGSGGRTIGEKLAGRLGVSFYDKALINALTRELHLTVEEIEKFKGQKPSWWSVFQSKIAPFRNPTGSLLATSGEDIESEVLTTEDIFRTETRILQEIAHDESCVITGRSGFFVFQHHPNHMSILIQASMEHRVQRVMAKQGLSEKEAKKVIKEVDETREEYMKNNAHTSRYDTRNYDLVIKMDGSKTEEEVANAILAFIG
jgi:cytidylate kinase